MEARVAKELLHIQRWLGIAASIVAGGRDAYESDEVAQEAGDALMSKIGEAAKTLAARGLEAPDGVSWSDAVGLASCLGRRTCAAVHGSACDART